ncbi:hypothetical protein BN871_AC_00840 [Paenibacillus sp. P22]|nr:hypothetical protein BN871_AC_00840 [Paenibacillus sp. P22]
MTRIHLHSPAAEHPGGNLRTERLMPLGPAVAEQLRCHAFGGLPEQLVPRRPRKPGQIRLAGFEVGQERRGQGLEPAPLCLPIAGIGSGRAQPQAVRHSSGGAGTAHDKSFGEKHIIPFGDGIAGYAEKLRHFPRRGQLLPLRDLSTQNYILERQKQLPGHRHLLTRLQPDSPH